MRKGWLRTGQCLSGSIRPCWWYPGLPVPAAWNTSHQHHAASAGLTVGDGVSLVLTAAWVSSKQDTFTPRVRPLSHWNFVFHGARVLQVTLGKLQTRCRVPLASVVVLEISQPAPGRRVLVVPTFYTHGWWRPLCSLRSSKQQNLFLYDPVLEVSRQFLLLPSCCLCAEMHRQLWDLIQTGVCLPKSCPMNSVYLRSPTMLQEHLMDDQWKHLHAKGCENFCTSDFLVFLLSSLVEFAKISKIVFSCCHYVALFVEFWGKHELNPFLNIVWNGMQWLMYVCMSHNLPHTLQCCRPRRVRYI